MVFVSRRLLLNLRKSNLTAPSAQAFDPEKHLMREDIKFTSQGVLIFSTSAGQRRDSTVRVFSLYLCLSFPIQSSVQLLLFSITSVLFPPYPDRPFSAYLMDGAFRH